MYTHRQTCTELHSEGKVSRWVWPWHGRKPPELVSIKMTRVYIILGHCDRYRYDIVVTSVHTWIYWYRCIWIYIYIYTCLYVYIYICMCILMQKYWYHLVSKPVWKCCSIMNADCHITSSIAFGFQTGWTLEKLPKGKDSLPSNNFSGASC